MIVKWLLNIVLFSLCTPNVQASFLESVFTQLYESDVLAYGSETTSGMGASLAHTEAIRRELPTLFKTYNITSILDVGCGDFNWMQHVIPQDITYIGMDVVKSVIDTNNKRYKAENISFVHGDCCSDPLPKVDLIICRDVLAHLSYAYAEQMIENIMKSGSQYVLFTSYSGWGRVNRNLSERQVGGNYCINMRKMPFMFLRPLYEMNEKCPSPFHVVTPDKTLGLWNVSSLDQRALSAVTYLDDACWGGRLGDKLLMYIKARWMAYKHGFCFFYKPFKYSDMLELHNTDKRWHREYLNEFDMVEDPYCSLKNPQAYYIDLQSFIKDSRKLYIINYYFQPEEWGTYQRDYDSQNVTEWNDLYDDQVFRDILRKKIKPLNPINEIELPNDRITVALHVRKGGGYDEKLLSLQFYGDPTTDEMSRQCVCGSHSRDFTDIGYTVKLPPDQFYVQQIKALSEMYNDAPLYVHLFTDDQNPQALIDRYNHAVGKKNIAYGCRQSGNRHDANILDDLFNMIRFDCLIRSGSNFPQIAQLLGNYQVVLYPKRAEWRSMLNVYEVGIVKRHDGAA